MSRIPLINFISDAILPYYPDLRKKLRIAGLEESPEEYLDKALFTSFVMALMGGVTVALFGWALSALIDLQGLVLTTFAFAIPFWVFLAYLNIHKVDVLLYRLRKAIDYDLVFAVKHIIIALSSGTPIFDALAGVSKGYGQVSEEFRKIVERVALGESLTSVLREVADTTPSSAFKRVLIQIANSIVSGANVADSLDAVVNQIAKEQLLEIKEYGQKLNPVVMFYLVLGVILPSLGVAFFIIVLSFVSGGIDLPFYYLLAAALVVGLIQFLFLAYIESSRPRYALIS